MRNPWALHRPDDDEQGAANRQTESLAGLAVTLTVVVVSLFLVRQLNHKVAIEDCLMAGRMSCDRVVIRGP